VPKGAPGSGDAAQRELASSSRRVVGGMHVVCRASAASSRHAQWCLPVRHVGPRQRGLAVVSSLLSALAGGWLQISTRRREGVAEAVGRMEGGPQIAN
jgi:hypothetical protein